VSVRVAIDGIVASQALREPHAKALREALGIGPMIIHDLRGHRWRIVEGTYEDGAPSREIRTEGGELIVGYAFEDEDDHPFSTRMLHADGLAIWFDADAEWPTAFVLDTELEVRA
jgi:hypothetical protein